jgi:ribosomal protein S5
MKTEEELRELHTRLVSVLSYARSVGMPIRELRELIGIKIQLEWTLGTNTASAREWQAATFKAIQNLEGLKKTHERSREAAAN